MSRSFGEWLSKRRHVLRSWDKIVNVVAHVLKKTIPDIEVYVFGSTIENKLTSASDIDILVVVPEKHDKLETYILLSEILEDKLGSAAYMIDLHVTNKNKLSKPPYTWWLKKSRKIT